MTVVEIFPDNAMRLCAEHAYAGVPDAQALLAGAFLYGEWSVPKDGVKAQYWAQKAANSGSELGKNLLEIVWCRQGAEFISKAAARETPSGLDEAGQELYLSGLALMIRAELSQYGHADNIMAVLQSSHGEAASDWYQAAVQKLEEETSNV